MRVLPRARFLMCVHVCNAVNAHTPISHPCANDTCGLENGSVGECCCIVKLHHPPALVGFPKILLKQFGFNTVCSI